MLYNILILGRSATEGEVLREKISKNKLYRVECVETASRALNHFMTRQTDLVILNIDLFTRDKIPLAANIRGAGFEFPILILSRVIAGDTYTTIEKLGKSLILEKPYEDKDLWGLLEKMIQGQIARQRYHRRFYTNQNAALEPFHSAKKLEGRLCNLSRGGAYLEHNQEGGFQQGELVKVNVDLSSVSRAYSVNAKVVWSKPATNGPLSGSIGVEFLKTGDVYRNLLSKL